MSRVPSPTATRCSINPGNGLAGNPYLYKNLSHDVLKDFAPVTTLVKLPFCSRSAPISPAKSVKEFLALMKQKGDKASYGYPNNLSLAAGELLKERTGLKAVAVPYKSTPEALNDMTNGLIDYLWSDATFALGQAKGGKMRVLAVTSTRTLRARSQPADVAGKRRAQFPSRSMVGRVVSGQDAAADRRQDVGVAQRNSGRSETQGISDQDRAGRSVSRARRSRRSNISSRTFRAGPRCSSSPRSSRNNARADQLARLPQSLQPAPERIRPFREQPSGVAHRILDVILLARCNAWTEP